MVNKMILKNKIELIRDLPYEIWLILVFAAIIRLVRINNLFPSIDELIGLRRVFKMADGDLNPHWFGYPTGYYYFLLSLIPFRYLQGVFFNHWSHPRDLFHAYLFDPMSVSTYFRVAGVIFSLIAIFITYLAARKLVERRWAWICPLFLAISPFAVHWSTQLWPEALIILPSSISLYFSLKYLETGQSKYILLCGLGIGLAVSIKYNAVYLSAFVPCVAWLAYEKEKISNPWQVLKHITFAALAALVGFILATPYSILDWQTFLKTFANIISEYRELSHVGLDAGYQLLQSSPLLWWGQALNQISPGFALIIMILLLILIFTWKSEYLLLIFPILVMFPFLTWFGKSEHYHLIPILPIFACIIGVSLKTISTRFERKKFIITILITSVIILPGLIKTFQDLGKRSLPDTRIVSRNWIESNISDGTKILLDKYYVPHLVRTEKQVDFLLENMIADVYFKSYQKDMPRTTSYWIEHLPIAITSDEMEVTDNGELVQPELLTPEEYAKNGFEYVVLSEGTYSRFFVDEKYKEIRDYYQSFFSFGETVYEIAGDNRPGPKISVLKLSTNK